MHLRRADVVAKATQLLDDYGIADLTMRRLARELNVSPGALYWHFADKQELLGAVADRILAVVDAGTDLETSTETSTDTEWPMEIGRICTKLRDALLSTTDGAELVSATLASGTSAAMTSVLTRLTASAAASGAGPEHAALIARTIVYYVLGFTSDEQSRIQWDAAGALGTDQSVLNGITGDADPSARFGFGLDLLIAGVTHVPVR